MAVLNQIELPDGTIHNISIPFIIGTGSTAGTWLGELDGLTEYYDGLLILYKPSVAGASTTTLNINSLGAKTCYVNNTTKLTTHFPVNQPILLVYSTSQNSGCWMCIDDYWTNSDTYTSAYCGTSAATAAKTATMTRYAATPKSFVHINFRYANTVASALTLNINDKGAKPIYINGIASSATNYTLPAGPYIAYYDGTNYYFRTDGKLTADIIGNAATATNASKVNNHTVDKDVPSNADMTAYTGTGLITVSNHQISTTAEVNQNAFSNVKVGSTTVTADTETDTLELAGSNVTLTPDATNNKVTIGITSSNVITALGYTPYNNTNPNGYTKVESSTNGKIKINGTDTTVYTHPGSGTNPHGTTAADVGAATSTHTHGNIQNGGTLQTTDVAIANGDKLVVTDSSDSNKIARTSVSFDGTTTNQALTPKGTFEDFLNEDDFEILTETGNPVSVITKAEGYAKSAIVTFTPKQSGTGDPSPENIRPISGRDGLVLNQCGKNLFDESGFLQASNWTKNADGSYTGSNVNIDYTVFNAVRYCLHNFFDNHQLGVNYTASFNIQSSESPRTIVGFNIKNAETGTIRDVRTGTITTTEDFTLTTDCSSNEYVVALWFARASTRTITFKNFQVEKGTTATTYEPYQGSTHTATFPDTVYGGSYDFVSGKAYINKWYCDMGDLTYAQGDGYLQVSKDSIQTLTGKNPKRETASSTSGLNISEICPVQGTVNQFRFNTNLTKDEFEAIAGGHLFVFELETPAPISLTPEDVNLLKGSNTVWTDGDTVQIKYSKIPNGTPKSVKIYYQNGNLFIY